MVDRKKKGEIGEQLAAGFLKKKGYRIIETNYRCRFGEIDIICRNKKCLVFVEVRTKGSADFGTPEESLNRTKLSHLSRAAEYYLQNHDKLPEQWKIDLVAVELDGENRLKRIEQIENAVEE
jgi:putative endonuclease